MCETRPDPSGYVWSSSLALTKVRVCLRIMANMFVCAPTQVGAFGLPLIFITVSSAAMFHSALLVAPFADVPCESHQSRSRTRSTRSMGQFLAHCRHHCLYCTCQESGLFCNDLSATSPAVMQSPPHLTPTAAACSPNGGFSRTYAYGASMKRHLGQCVMPTLKRVPPIRSRSASMR